MHTTSLRLVFGRVTRLALTATLAGAAFPAANATAQRPAIDSARLLGDISVLAHDSMEGRRIGTPGGARARAFLLRAMARVGLSPLADSFPLPFSVQGRAGAAIAGVNLAGVVRGTKRPDQYIVVSAHYDHLGVRNNEVFNGADDNASGTAGVLAIAQWYRAHPAEHSLLFVLFDGEEGGEVGSKAFVAHPPVPLERILADVNLDMVSRNAKGELYVAGATASPWLRPLLDSTAAHARVKLLLGHDSGAGQDNWTDQSDQGSFAAKGVPFAYFGVEDHPDYHRATDDVERIQPSFYLRAVETVADFVQRLDRAVDRAVPLDARMQRVMDRPEFTHASWGIEFYDLAAKRTVYSVNRERLFVPGSTTKLVTTGTALELLGVDHRFHTRVYRTGAIRNGTLEGDLVLVAAGDPNLSGRLNADGTLAFTNVDHSYGGLPLPVDPLTSLRSLARQVKEKGITRIAGRVIVDASWFREGERELGTRVVISPLVLNDNVVDVVVVPGARVGDSAAVIVSPKTSYVTVRASIVTGDSAAPAALRSVEDSTNRDARVLTISGRVPRASAPANARWAVASPSRFAEIVFAEVLEWAGVRAVARAATDAVDLRRIAAAYADSTLMAEQVSAPFGEEAKVILKMSQNLHASMMPHVVARTVADRDAGKAGGTRDSSKTGFDLARDWLERAGLDVNGAVQGDGAGGDAFFSPAFMTRYLEYCATRPWAAVFRRSLPILGKDGTLALIQVQSEAAGQVTAKTGTYSSYDPLHRRSLVHAKGLAGYFTSKSGKPIAFAIYLNNFAIDGTDPAAYAGQVLGEIAALAWANIP